jgi:hypothetical protein
MRTRARLIAVTLTATAALLATVTGAGARNIDITNGEQGLRLVWRPVSFEAFGETVTCNLTLEGTFSARTFAKRRETPIARITRAAVESCTGGTFRVNSETLPWTVTYQSFTGTLPRISTITKDLVQASFEVQPFGFPKCRYTSETGEPIRGIATLGATGDIDELALLSTLTIRGKGLLCEGAEGRFIGSATETVQNETAHTEFRLI